MGKNNWELYFDAIKNQNWKKALNALNSILKEDPQNPQVYLKIGDVMQKTGDRDGAVNAYHQSAKILINQGFSQKAIAIFKIILRLDPDNNEAVKRTKDLIMELDSFKKMEIQPEEKVEQALTAGLEPAIEKKFEEDVVKKVEEKSVLRIPFFLTSLPEDECKQLIELLEPRSFLAGKTVIEEGDSGDSVYVITSGSARVVAHILGREMELAVLSVGDVFGEVAFLTGRPRTASVLAVDNLEVIEFNRLILEKIFEKYPDTLKKLEDFYQFHVKDTIEKVRSYMKKGDT